ncbi:MAG TPA: DMT family transporter [Ilumatobacteraceae bacterium]|nr:DMT family transporter [Ilumatobacteraceae bacterium]HRB03660.1 DMT family transporter [Ilumatobacteraceae bacterium]
MTTTAAAATPAQSKMSVADWGLLALPGLVWGTSFYFIAEGLDAFPAAMITPMRVGFGALTLGLFPAARRVNIARRDMRKILLLGVIWMAIPLSIFPFAEERVSSSVTGMLNGATPLFIAVVAAFMARRLPPRQQMVGVAVGFAGVVLIAVASGTSGNNSWFGIGLIFVALVFYGISLNIAVPLQQKYGSLPVLWRAQMIAFAIVTPFAIPSVGDIEFKWGPFLAVVALGVFGTALAFVVMASNAGRVGSTRASVSVYIVPVVSLLLGALVRHETVAALAVVGCGVAVSGAYLTNRARH